MCESLIVYQCFLGFITVDSDKTVVAADLVEGGDGGVGVLASV